MRKNICCVKLPAFLGAILRLLLGKHVIGYNTKRPN